MRAVADPGPAVGSVPMLALLQELSARAWPVSPLRHSGDLAWQLAGRLDGLSIVAVDDAAAGFVDGEDGLCVLVDPARAELLDDLLDHFDSRTVLTVDTDHALLDRLRRRGYRPDTAGWWSRQIRHSLTGLPEPVLPPGFSLRQMTAFDLVERVAVHRAAWHPSQQTEQRYRQVMATPTYRPEFDLVVRIPDGRFVANCLGWLDPITRVGVFEPVGTHPDFRRQGLGSAVCLAVMHALRAAGATECVVYPVLGHPTSVAYPLYRSLGFTDGPEVRRYVR
ncbi:GNAT family N-acetyltransferase [Pseudonocardiaceae bacterium YIM PH 21723]|nr:GNAT family N-acetyltransferase [Pseudonocardiaceae bacterium YIM PH 21723]